MPVRKHNQFTNPKAITGYICFSVHQGNRHREYLQNIYYGSGFHMLCLFDPTMTQ